MNDSSLKTTDEGFLENRLSWSPSVAKIIAKNENIELTDDHWTVIHILQEFYENYSMEPALRILIKKLSEVWEKNKASSLYLYKLFPDGPIKQGSKIAGLPKPLKCL